MSAAVSILPVAGRTRVSRFHGAWSSGGGGGGGGRRLTGHGGGGKRDVDGLAALPGRRAAG